MENNDIDVELFSHCCINELLLRGRGKNRNLLLTGPTNCGKSFLLNPLKVIYRTFCNPATGTYRVGVENAECILLTDFRWSAQIIPWHVSIVIVEKVLLKQYTLSNFATVHIGSQRPVHITWIKYIVPFLLLGM